MVLMANGFSYADSSRIIGNLGAGNLLKVSLKLWHSRT